MESVKKAIERKIKEVYFLEHTYVFKEFYFLYDEMKNYNACVKIIGMEIKLKKHM